MKNIYYLFLFITLFLKTEYALASHIQGADISYTYIGNNQYRFVINLYRDCSSSVLLNSPLAINSTLTGSFGQCSQSSSSGTIGSLMTLVSGPTEVSQLCPSELINSNCVGGTQPGTQKYVLERIITLNFSCGANAEWQVGFSFSARNTAITNLQNPGTTDLYIEARIKQAAANGANSSPVFSVLPVPYVCNNQPVIYAQGAVDAEGDSLRFTSINPLAVNATPALYVNPYTPTSPLATSSGFSVNAVNGQLTYTPNQLQVAAITLLVEEFRNGVLISSTIRDLQVIVRNCSALNPNTPSISTPVNIVGGTLQGNTIRVCAGTNVNFQFNVSDPDINTNLNVTDNHLVSIPNSSVNYVGTGSNLTGTFNWTSSTADTGINVLTVVVSDNACPISGVSVLSYNINVVNCGCIINSNITTVSPSCNNQNNGSITASGLNGTQPYQYIWSNGRTTAANTGLVSGIYTVTITDAIGCTATSTVILTQPSALNISTLVQPARCGLFNGSIDLTVTGGTSAYSYLWSNAQNSQDISGLGQGVYQVSVTDANGCTISSNIPVSSQPIFTVGSTASNTSCGANNGSINLTVTGASNPQFIWSNGRTTEDLSGLSAGAYTYTVTDNSGCTVSNTLVVNSNTPTTVTIDSTINPTCQNSTNGAAYISVSGSITCSSPTVVINEVMYRPAASNGVDPNTGEYIELIGPPGTNIGCFVLSDGDWTITIPPGTLIPADGILTIGNNVIWGPGFFDLDAENCGCFVEGTGGSSLLILTDGGEYVSLFNNAGSFIDGLLYGTPSAANTPPNGALSGGGVIGTIGLTGCPTSVTIPGVASFQTHPGGVASNSSLIRSPDGSGGLWSSQANGSPNQCNVIQTPTYNYLWSNGAITQDVTGLSAGVYSVTITDQSNCNIVSAITLTANPAPTVTLQSDPATCGQSNGVVEAVNQGSATPYLYNWSNGATTSIISGLSAGNYTVTVTDTNGCDNIFSAVVNNIPGFTLSNNSQNNNCNGSNNAFINITTQSGQQPFVFQWSSGQTTQNLSNLVAGIYTLTATDANGCTSTNTISVTEPQPFVLNSQVFDIACTSANIGAIQLNTSGSVAPYQYAWSTGATTQNLSSLASGSYTVTITDFNSCTTTQTFSVQSTSGLQLIQNVDQVSCNGLNDACAQILVSGGQAPYQWLWSTGQTQDSICNLAAGNYIVTVTDNGAGGNLTDTLYSEDFEATHNWALNVSTGVNGADHNFWVVNDNEGGVLPNGCGVANNGDQTLHITSVFFPAGGAAYDAGGLCGLLFCPQTNMRAESPLISTIGASNLNLSFDFISNGQGLIDNASVYYNDGTGWNLLNASIKSPVCPSGQGRWAQFSATLPASCNNIPNLQIAVNWTNNDDGVGTDPSVAINNVLITSIGAAQTACSSIDTIIITEPAILQSTTVAVVNAGCLNNGSVNISTTGGTAPYSFLWSNGATSEDISGLSAGTYNLTITDANACETTNLLNVVSSASAPLINVLSQNSPSCNGGSNGSISLQVSGGSSPFIYNWSNGQNTATASGLSAGIYSITVNDLNNCSVSTSITLTEPSAVSVNIVSVSNASCSGFSNGSATVLGTGGNSNFTYNWSNGQNTATASGLSAGVYSVTVADNNGCTSQGIVTITDNNQISTGNVNLTDASCAGNDGAIDISPTGGNAPYSFQWSNGSNSQNLSNIPSGNYIVTITDANGCYSISNTFTLLTGSSVSIVLDSTRGAYCFPALQAGIFVTVNGGTQPYQFNWSNGSSTEDLQAIDAGNYSLTVTDLNGCTLTFSQNISAAQTTLLDAYIGTIGVQDTVIDLGESISLGVNPVLPDISYIWRHSNLLQSSDTSSSMPNLNPVSSGNYQIILEYSNNLGCVAYDTLQLLVEEPQTVEIPTAFSPNDDGVNDFFSVVGLNSIYLLEFKIFNKWGQLVYDDLDGIWDGSYQGVMQPRDVYMFVISWKRPFDNEIITKRGQLTLLK
jgi:gliding motility-associated-like protein